MILVLLAMLSGCSTATRKPVEQPADKSLKVLCEETAPLRTAHVSALLASPNLETRRTGVALIQPIDAVCAV